MRASKREIRVAEVYGNRYEVIERVGDGGMASVFRGSDTVLRRDVAIKVMHPHLAGRQDARARFTREAQSIARLKHPNIVDVYDFSVGTEEESYLVTEFVHGETLSAFANAHGPFWPQCAALIGHAMTSALAHAHAAGIIHRDIKPDNLMISRDGQLKLMDFGIATAIDMEGMTATGAIVGSPAHMAPEQIEGEDLDARCDVFACGIVLYFLVTRRLPFTAANPHALFRLILEGKYESPMRHNTAVDRQFEAMIARCLARNRDDRYASATDLQNALSSYLKGFRMSDVATLLPRFLKAPELFQFDLKPALVENWTAEGRRYAQTNQLALAIDAFQRALAIDSGADEAKKGLANLTSRSRRRKKVMRFAAVVVGFAALATAGYGLMYLPVPEPLKTGPARGVGLDETKIGSPALVQAEPKTVPPSLPVPKAATPTEPVATEPAQPAVNPANPVQVAAVTDRRATGRKLASVDWKALNRKGSQAAQTTPPPPVDPPVLVDVQLSCVPPSAALRFRQESFNGFAQLQLEPGSYSFVCEWPQAACPGCDPLLTPFPVYGKDKGNGPKRYKGLREDAPGFRDAGK